MALSKDEIEIFYFRFLNDEIPIKDFEQWIYATPELENYFGEAAYFELASFNFRQPAAQYEFSKLINQHIIPAEFYNWQLKRLLQALLDDTMDPVDVFERLYDLAYSEGYSFLSDIGIEYAIWVDKIPKRAVKHLWDEKEYQRLREPLEKYIIHVKQEIELLLQALDSGDLKIINRDKYLTEYQMNPSVAQKIKDYNQTRQLEWQNKRQKEMSKHQAQLQKKWWEFWK